VFVQLLKDWKGKPAGEKIDVPEEFAPLLIDQQLAIAIPGDPLNALVTRAMQDASAKWAQSMDQVINLALTKFKDAQSQAKKFAVPAIFGDTGQGDPKRNFGDWLLAVARKDSAYLEKTYGSYQTKAAMAEASGVTGGYIVPPEFAQSLLTLISEQSVIRPRAFVQPMASATFMMPFLDVSTQQAAGTSPFFGGVSFVWTEEAQARTETEPQFKMLELKAHELSGYAVSSNILLQDAAFGLEKFLLSLFSKATAWYEDYAFIQGNGVGKPLGLVNANCAISFNRAGGAGTQTFALGDAAKMLSKLLPASLNTACWIIHPYALPGLVQLADAGNRVIWIANQNTGLGGAAQGKIPGQLFGLPVYISEKCSTYGTKGDIILTDPALYVIGDRMQIEIAASEHVNFLKNQMTWRVVERVDGQPWLDKAVTLADGASTVSSIVLIS
jgi:HK97 family phage major capsid protein